MPHFTLEYSENLEALADIGALCEIVRRAAVETGIFPTGGIRVRAMAFRHVAIADGDKSHAFADLTLRMGEGRELAARKAAGEAIFAALSRALEPAFAKTQVALSFNIYEIDSRLSWKRNTIHDAMQRRTA